MPSISKQKKKSSRSPNDGDLINIDPKNARLHPDRNKAFIRKSLEEVGPFRSIAIDGDNVIRAGNGVYEQAKALGLPIRIVEAAPGELIAVKRSDLRGDKAVRAALLDNRSGELSEWDTTILSSLMESDKALLDGIFDDTSIEKFMESAALKSSKDLVAAVRTVKVKAPPTMTWTLIGIPTVHYGRISKTIDQLRDIPGVLCESTVNAGQ